jgi:hypothetical protein
MGNLILSHEALFRFGSFIAVFILMALWERVMPRSIVLSADNR